MKRKPIILTREERKQRNLEALKKRADRKKAKHDKLIDVEVMKQSHDWYQSKIYNITKTSVQYQVSNCKKCGIHYQLFKAKPEVCPRAKIKEAEPEEHISLLGFRDFD